MKKEKTFLTVIFGLFCIVNLIGQSLNPTSSISETGSADAFKAGYTFAYTTSGTPWNGSLISYGGFSVNNYDTQISSDYGPHGGSHISYRTKNGDTNTWNTWNELATRGANNFTGDQSIIGNQSLTGNFTIGREGEISTICGPSSSGAIQIKTNGHFGGSTNRYLRLGWRDNNASFTSALSINDDLNVGIGTTEPSSYQHGGNNKVIEVSNPNTTINSQSHLILSTGSILPNSSLGSLTWTMPNITSPNKGLAYLGVISGINSTTDNPSSSMIFATRSNSGNNWNPNMVLSDTGNLGIGILTPNNKLDVNGTIHSKEVKVDMLGWSDFVFNKEYNLPTLQEVEKHITEKGHLENIPSEKEVLENGINLGEMNAKLLQKIEELTLYSIQQNKKINEQAEEIESLKNLVLRVAKIEKELSQK